MHRVKRSDWAELDQSRINFNSIDKIRRTLSETLGQYSVTPNLSVTSTVERIEFRLTEICIICRRLDYAGLGAIC